MKIEFNQNITELMNKLAKDSFTVRGKQAYEQGNYAEAVNNLEQGVNKGEIYSNLMLGMMYEVGECVARNESIATNLLKPVTNFGGQEGSELNSFLFNWYGMNVPNVTRAFDFTEYLSEINDVYMAQLGIFCYDGIYCQKDEKRAFEIFKDLYSNDKFNDMLGIYGTYLGMCYLYGKGVKQDTAYGFKLLKEASTKNLLEGRVFEELGNCYLHGIAVKQDKTKAIGYFKRANADKYQHAKHVLISRLERTWEYFGMFGR